MQLCIVPYNNISAVNGSTTSNTLNEYKSMYEEGYSFSLDLKAISGKVAVVAMLAEETSEVTMTITGYPSVTDSTNTSLVVPDLYTLPGYVTTGYVEVSVTKENIGFGGGKYLAAYINIPSSTTSMTLTTSRKVKVSKLLVGNYWSPIYGTPYGPSISMVDTSEVTRLQKGDAYVIPGPRHKTLQLDLQYLVDTDRDYLFNIISNISKTSGIFISVFSSSIDQEQEQVYSIYGKLTAPPGISHAMYSMYASSVQLEEF